MPGPILPIGLSGMAAMQAFGAPPTGRMIYPPVPPTQVAPPGVLPGPLGQPPTVPGFTIGGVPIIINPPAPHLPTQLILPPSPGGPAGPPPTGATAPPVYVPPGGFPNPPPLPVTSTAPAAPLTAAEIAALQAGFDLAEDALVPLPGAGPGPVLAGATLSRPPGAIRFFGPAPPALGLTTGQSGGGIVGGLGAAGGALKMAGKGNLAWLGILTAGNLQPNPLNYTQNGALLVLPPQVDPVAGQRILRSVFQYAPQGPIISGQPVPPIQSRLTAFQPPQAQPPQVGRGAIPVNVLQTLATLQQLQQFGSGYIQLFNGLQQSLVGQQQLGQQQQGVIGMNAQQVLIGQQQAQQAPQAQQAAQPPIISRQQFIQQRQQQLDQQLQLQNIRAAQAPAVPPDAQAQLQQIQQAAYQAVKNADLLEDFQNLLDLLNSGLPAGQIQTVLQYGRNRARITNLTGLGLGAAGPVALQLPGQ